MADWVANIDDLSSESDVATDWIAALRDLGDLDSGAGSDGDGGAGGGGVGGGDLPIVPVVVPEVGNLAIMNFTDIVAYIGSADAASRNAEVAIPSRVGAMGVVSRCCPDDDYASVDATEFSLADYFLSSKCLDGTTAIETVVAGAPDRKRLRSSRLLAASLTFQQERHHVLRLLECLTAAQTKYGFRKALYIEFVAYDGVDMTLKTRGTTHT